MALSSKVSGSLPIVLALLLLYASAESASLPGASGVKGQLISVMTGDKVPLFGLWYTPDGPTQSVVIHIPGGPGAFYSAQDMAPLAAALNSKGYAFLSINMRTAGNMAYARFEDYLLDVSAATRFVKDRGNSDITLLGHSLGSARAVYYLEQSRDPAVKALVLSGVITSPYLEAQLRWTVAERGKYDAFLETQRERIRSGHPRELDSYAWNGSRALEMSAATWVNLFGNPTESNASTVKFAKDIKVPVLIVHGSNDEAAVIGNAVQLKAALTSSPSVDLVIAQGANHLFIGQADQYAQIVAEWVGKRMPLVAGAAAH